MSKNPVYLVSFILAAAFLSSASPQTPQKAQLAIESRPVQPEVDINYGKIPLYFIPNMGQVDGEALFYADTSRYTLWITQEGLVFDSLRKLDQTKHPDEDSDQPGTFARYVSRVKFLNANPRTEVISEDRSDYKVSYFRGEDRSQWRTGIETSQAVLYHSLYPGIDLRVYGIEREVEYDFIVKPQADVNDIAFAYQDEQGTKLDARKTRLDRKGNLIIQTAFGEMTHSRPTAYQKIRGRHIQVMASYKPLGENTYGFQVGDYDKTRELIIDPLVIVYSTYLGGKLGEGTTYLAVDMTGAAYLACWVNSRNFPTKNPLYPKLSGAADATITKLSPDGKSLVYSSYLGGPEQDGPLNVAVDMTGAAYVVGVARSNFPNVNALYDYGGNQDGFIVKLHPSGTSLVYATYLGGSEYDRIRGVAVDQDGNAYVAGLTRSSDFPTKRAFQKKYSGNDDAFLAEINATGSKLVFSTFFGGSEADDGRTVKIDEKGNVYLVGETSSTDIPTKKAFQKKNAGQIDTYLAKFNKRGRKLLYSTYLGGTENDGCRSLDLDIYGNIYILGTTNSTDFPLKRPLYDGLAGDHDMFLAKFNPKAKKILFSTYFGGPRWDNGTKVVVDVDNTIYVRGYTESKKFPTKDAVMKKYQGKGDAVLAQFSADGQSLIFSTFFGGSEWDRGVGFALDYMGGIYLACGTESPDIPVKNAFQKKMRGAGDMFITKFIKE